MVHQCSRALRWGAIGAAGVVLASCTSTVILPKAKGTIAGIASSCPSAGPAHKVTVVVFEDSTIRTSATILSGAHFMFHLSPGHYVVSTGPLFSRVTLGAGGSATVNLRARCAGRAP